SIRDDRYRLILRNGEKSLNEQQVELYDLGADIDSIENIASEHPEVVSRLHDYLKQRKQSSDG
ncbi:hypothetical protein, partial [Marivita sp.]|uniref:hypothetical protein n=1 Tax=Marivita sp. TaxID=2003365 RepID=UPI0025BF7C06